MKRSFRFGYVLAVLALAACGPARTPLTPKFDIGASYTETFSVEAYGDADAAAEAYLALLEKASVADLGDRKLPTVSSALAALLYDAPSAIGDAVPHSALLYRAPKFAGTFVGDGGPATARLRTVWEKASNDPFTRPTLAFALVILATARGDAKDAAVWRARAGFPTTSLVTPPHHTGLLSGIAEATDWDAPGAKAPAQVVGPLGLSADVAVAPVRNGALQLSAATAEGGIRDVLFDLEAPNDGIVGVTLRCGGPARLLVNGKAAFDRPYLEGETVTTDFITLTGVQGRVRLALRIPHGTLASISFTDGSGSAVSAGASKPNSVANGTFREASVLAVVPPHNAGEELLLAAGDLATGHRARAEARLASPGFAQKTDPALLLLSARALEGAPDLNPVIKGERLRAVHEQVLAAWPYSWEAILGHAKLEGARRAPGEARFFALADLAKHEKDLDPGAKSLVLAYRAALQGRDPLPDEAAKLVKAADALPGLPSEGATKTTLKTPLAFDITALLVPRDFSTQVTFACTPGNGSMQDTRSCREARLRVGDFAGATAELDRLAALYGSEESVRSERIRDALRTGDQASVTRLIASLLPGEKSLAYLGRADSSDRAYMQSARKSPDAPYSLSAALRLGAGAGTPLPFDGAAEALIQKDLAAKAFPGAGTVVLQRSEAYTISPDGLLHIVTFDVRRVDGTTDVENNAEAPSAFTEGREQSRVLRRRIHKADGRILEPEKTPRASQDHADLSQLEPGDYIEALYESYALPDGNGALGFEGPDLMPERTIVLDGEIRVEIPKTLHGVFSAHPLLGPPVVTEANGSSVRTYKVHNTPIRRQEEAVPHMDRDVAVSFSTATWEGMARTLRDKLVALDDNDAEVTAWAKSAATRDGKLLPPSRDLLDAIVVAAGKAIHQPNGALLADGDDHPDGSRSVSARAFLASRDGSRTWLIHRALREFGLRSELVVAEATPWSSRADTPVRAGRFTHPLLLVHVPKAPGGADTEAVLVDADVMGPPLPAGRISPELRGRLALFVSTGKVGPVPATATDDAGDEVDMRLVVDAKGDAKGDVTIVLRGRAAQGLADAFVRVVGDERQQALRSVVLGWLPFATVEAVSLSSSEGSWQVALRANVTIGGYAQIEEKSGSSTLLVPGIDPIHVVYPRPYSGTLRASYTSQGKRESDFTVRAGSIYHLHRRLEFPAGSKVAGLLGPVVEDSQLLHAKRLSQVAGTVLEEDFALSLASGTIPASDFPRFATSVDAVDSGFLTSARVTLSR